MFTGSKVLGDKEVALTAVRQCGLVLQFASATIKNDKEVVMKAVKQTGYALLYDLATLKNDKDVVIAAVNQNPKTIFCAGKKAMEYPEIIRMLSQKKA